MGVNKVVYGGKTIIDLTSLTVTPETLAYGVKAINAKGEVIIGTNKSISNWGELKNGGHIWNTVKGS